MHTEKLVARIIACPGPDYDQEIKLRNEVLRKPLGLDLLTEDLSREVNDIHIGLFRGRELIGTLILTPGQGYVKMRQVAVAENARGSNAGTQMVQFSEEVAREKGFSRIELNARLEAVRFYLKNGYTTEGNQFTEVGIPHFKMVKEL
ncbi:GNAT family N-acetyltransferase [Chitinophaga filiformis]|uniref:GNAT family N-acetyltransferase n=1 Tax=Chitinophaga filiformis TaxID=104663 RepID=A0ABY4I9S9_CHIFI|nr:GNAT family N-acetyltransferase [Chitinophaga filiformis]UPK72647.1 GNAT family N-acetyltransferase [Chitinophaga filiformis]